MKYALLALLVACTSASDARFDTVTLSVPSGWSGAFTDFAAFTPNAALAIDDAFVPAAADGPYRIAVVDDPAIPTEGYRVDAATPTTWVVHASDALGAQYGAADAFEHLGYRFRHPSDTLATLAPDLSGLGVLHTPQVRVRGLHLHVLHPIEAYFAMWDHGHQDEYRRIVDWLIKNRGNYVQWPSLNDILDATRYAEWQADTQQLIQIAHARGIRVGLGMELFGAANLQQAFDLVDDVTMPAGPQIAARLPMITGLPFDAYDLSFGEFFDTAPQQFIDTVDEVARQLHALTTAEMHALVHVGETQRVTFNGENIIFYFLIQFCDPSIIPDIHTVMYYDLYEDAGGAYHHTDFSEHRQYLLDRMCARKPHAYHPEDAYWVAYDDSVPQYLPLYVRSRYLDLQRLSVAGCGPLDEHLIFSSGFEWGYWLHDVASLRTSYELPPTFDATIADAYAPDLPAAAPLFTRVVQLQHVALIDQRLAPYLAGRDAVIDAGRSLDVVSQPDRVTFDDLAAMAPADRAQFDHDVLAPLEAYRDALADANRALVSANLPDSRWSREIVDGFAIDLARARFSLATYRAVVDHLAGADADPDRAEATGALADAQAIVVRRDGDLHDTHGTRLTGKTPNHTVYGFGYLYMAATLCYWNRELAQVDAILTQSSTIVPPACILN